jgi:hypothetical protein
MDCASRVNLVEYEKSAGYESALKWSGLIVGM